MMSNRAQPDRTVGMHLITTTSGSRYLVNHDRMTLSRVAAPSPLGGSALRRDGEDIDIIEMTDCVVGERMVFIVDLHLPGVPFTLRPTTPVVSIERIDFGQLLEASPR